MPTTLDKPAAKTAAPSRPPKRVPRPIPFANRKQVVILAIAATLMLLWLAALAWLAFGTGWR